MRLPRVLVYTRIDIPRGASREEVGPEDLAGWDADDRLASQQITASAAAPIRCHPRLLV